MRDMRLNAAVRVNRLEMRDTMRLNTAVTTNRLDICDMRLNAAATINRLELRDTRQNAAPSCLEGQKCVAQ